MEIEQKNAKYESLEIKELFLFFAGAFIVFIALVYDFSGLILKGFIRIHFRNNINF